MEKPKITEEMNLETEWYKMAEKQTYESIPYFVNRIVHGFDHDYGTICHAIAASGLAMVEALAEEEGITGFQFGMIMWMLIKHGWYPSNETGMQLIDFDKMLWPQEAHRFEKTIPKATFENLQKMAKRKLDEANGTEADEVIDHWISIVDGKVPFGYKIEEK